MVNAKLAAALVAAQKAMPAVKDDAKANYGTYVTLDRLIAITRPILNDHGLAITQLPAVSEHGQPVLRTIMLHADSGESITADTPLILTQQNMQQLGAAITYARRYAWSAALGIADQEDDDGASASAPAPKPPKTAAEKKNTAPTTEQLVKEHDTLAGTWAKLETEFDSARAIQERARKLAEAKQAGDPAPYRTWLTNQIAGYKTLIDERSAQTEAQAKFPIPDKAKAAA